MIRMPKSREAPLAKEASRVIEKKTGALLRLLCLKSLDDSITIKFRKM